MAMQSINKQKKRHIIQIKKIASSSQWKRCYSIKYSQQFKLTSRHHALYKFNTLLLASLFVTESKGLAIFETGAALATLALCAILFEF